MKTSPEESSPEQVRKKRIDDLLLMIGGLEESIRINMEQEEWDFVKLLKELKPKYLERLRRVAYGLPEESKLPTTESR